MSDRDRKERAGIGSDSASRQPSEGRDGGVAQPRLQLLIDRYGVAGAQRYVQRKLAQRKAAAGEAAVDVQAAAAQGTSGASGSLPHLDAIQHSFGKHDVSHIKAHTDGAAAAGAAAMGAQAFATGDRVAFGATPSLHTAAHEAAHVVQQRAGVHLKGGVGEEGDVHERHADAVADRVVRGESAEALLSAGSLDADVAPANPGVQRRLVNDVDQTPIGDPAGAIRDYGNKHGLHLTEEDIAGIVNAEAADAIPRSVADAVALHRGQTASNSSSDATSASEDNKKRKRADESDEKQALARKQSDDMAQESVSSSSSSHSHSSAVPDLQASTVAAVETAIAAGQRQAAIDHMLNDPCLQPLIRTLGVTRVDYVASSGDYGECTYDKENGITIEVYALAFAASAPIPILYSTLRHELIHAQQYLTSRNAHQQAATSSSSAASSSSVFAYALEANRNGTAYPVAVAGSEVETHAWEIINQARTGAPLDFIYSRAVALQNHLQGFNKAGNTKNEKNIHKDSKTDLVTLVQQAKDVFEQLIPGAWPNHKSPDTYAEYLAQQKTGAKKQKQ